ncbi:unnamed protein product [Phytophthora fragariaefolia]|uniref:Unnamed protein product n=1 Tax=Phytophthora fragariaefolia TaxID=1490495 RepID=A0A9W6XQJ8_9STRA|nr:unnamed protein product [Phytophthora fragariaefolia]
MHAGAPQVTTLRFADKYAREPLLDAIDLQPGERRGYWKPYAPQKWYKQAKIHGKLNNCRGVFLLYTGAEVSILDTTFAREIGYLIDTDVTQNFVGIRDETYYTVGRTRVKITLAGNLVYFMDLWVGDLVGQHAILGMNFIVPVGVRIDTADGTACLSDELRIQLIGRRPLTVNASNTHDPELETGTRDEEAGDAVLVHKGSDLCAEELEAEMAMLPDLSLTAEVRIEDLKVGQPAGVDPEAAACEGERLRQIIWKRRKWLIGKGNALPPPPAAVGVICDIDVGDAKAVAQRVRKIPPQLKEKAADLIKGLLSAGMIQPSISPWASPIVVIVKQNGMDIRFCIDYRLVNVLTRLMVYPMPLVNDLLENLDKNL